MNSDAPADILLVEDSPEDLELAMRALKKAGVANHIQVARDGEEAIDFLFCRGPFETRRIEEAPRVILLDLKLPKVDGLEVLGAIKGDPRTRAIPVVVLTSSQEQSDLVASYGLGANSYIVKPVRFEGFVAAMEQVGVYWLLLNRPLTRGVEP